MSSNTAQALSQKLLALIEKRNFRDRYVRDHQDREQPLNFSIYLFIVTASLMVNAKRSFYLEPSTLAECHQSMLSYWGNNRMVLLTDFVKAPVELAKVVEVAKFKGDALITGQRGDEELPLYSLLSYSLMLRMKLYEQSLVQAVSSDDNEASLKVLAELTDYLITGEAIDRKPIGPDFWIRSLRVSILTGMIGEQLRSIETAF